MSRHGVYVPPPPVNGHPVDELDYGLLKARLKFVAPFDKSYEGQPHYILRMEANGWPFNVSVNSASAIAGDNGQEQVLMVLYEDYNHDILRQLEALPEGLHRVGFPKLDYLRTSGLLKISDLKPIPDIQQSTPDYDVNDEYNRVLGIDTKKGGETQKFFNGTTSSNRTFYPNSDDTIWIYAFGFIYRTNDGLHQTHMNQGNPRGSYDKENGVSQDGAVIIQRNGKYAAFFTAFQTQEVPTDDSTGYPLNTARPLSA